MKKYVMRFMLGNIEDLVDFFESLETRLREYIEGEQEQSNLLIEEANRYLAEAGSHQAKADRVQTLVNSLPKTV